MEWEDSRYESDLYRAQCQSHSNSDVLDVYLSVWHCYFLNIWLFTERICLRMPFGCLGPDNHQPQYLIYLVPDIRNVSMGPVPESYFECLGLDNHQPQCPIYWSQISEKSLWDQSQHSLLMCGTSPSLNCWHLGLVPERHFLCLGPDNDPHYLVPNIKNVSMGPVPDINNGDWD